MKKLCECPKCQSEEYVVSWHSVLFTLRDWPLMLIFASAVLLLGGALHLAEREVLLFILLSLFPLMFRFLDKFGCVKCQIEFYADPDQSNTSLAHTGFLDE